MRRLMVALGPSLFRLLVVLLCVTQPLLAWADTGHGEDEITLFSILYLGGFVLATVIAAIVIIWLQRRERNPSTGLPRPIRRRRAKGPLLKRR